MDAILTLQQKRLLRVDEAARILNISRWTVYRWVEAGRLGGTRIGAGSLRIFSETVVALIDLHSVGMPVAAGLSEGGRVLQEAPAPISLRGASRDGVRPRQQATL